MDYALVKQLKDAGFPQKDVIDFETFRRSWETIGFYIRKKEYIPTLPELIKACGDRFYALIKGDEGWYAHEKNGGVGILGKTPKEAVAKLWLELNKS